MTGYEYQGYEVQNTGHSCCLGINRLVARASSLSVTIGLWASSWRGTLLGCLMMQSLFVFLLLDVIIELAYQMVPAPHRELALM
jgi:hypothetical protein